jgi:hypothetical protein
MEQDKEKSSQSNRRKVLLGIGVLSLIPLSKSFFSFGNKNNAPAQTGTAKFLTQDGQLVEVDASKIASGRKKISDAELLVWVKNNH